MAKSIDLDNYTPEPNSGCWLWTGYLMPNGYGQLSRKRDESALAHRRMYEQIFGPIPNGLVIRHKCDVPSCVNPDHLVIGTQADNLKDMRERKRHQWGSRHTNSKLTEAIVLEIRASTDGCVALSRRYGVSPATIVNARDGKIWKHVK